MDVEYSGGTTGDFANDFMNPCTFGEVYGLRPNDARCDSDMDFHLDAIVNGANGFVTEQQTYFGKSLGCIDSEPGWWSTTTADYVFLFAFLLLY